MWPDFVQGFCFNMFFSNLSKTIFLQNLLINNLCMHAVGNRTFLSIIITNSEHCSCHWGWYLTRIFTVQFQSELFSGGSYIKEIKILHWVHFTYYLKVKKKNMCVCSYFVDCEEWDIIFNIISWLWSVFNFFMYFIDNDTQLIVLSEMSCSWFW